MLAEGHIDLFGRQRFDLGFEVLIPFHGPAVLLMLGERV